MKQQLSAAPRQSGIALITLLVLLILAGSYAFYRSSNIGAGRLQKNSELLMQLARAKEALIAYAAIDSSRPGRLLCPDIIGNGISPLLARDDCDAYGGGLPWKTLDLTEGSDSYGSTFRYYLSPAFGGNRSGETLNSDTATSLRLNVAAGAKSNDIAAVIIATLGPLDTRNADGDEYFYTGSSDASDDNDVIVAITRQELMAAVEQRIANETRSCLEQHAASDDNLQHTYPWPAPLSNSIFKGVSGSLFGMLPNTQAGNPDFTLKESINKLTATKNSLNFRSTAADTLATLQQLQVQAAYARALYDQLFIAALALDGKARKAREVFELLDSDIVATTTDKSTYTAQSALLPTAIGEALPSLSEFQEALADSGFDLFLIELQAENQVLKAKIDTATTTPTAANFDKLITPVNLFKNSLLDNSWSPNPEIESRISAAYTAAVDAARAVNLARPPTNVDDANDALAKATELFSANQRLQEAILNNRVNIDADEVASRASSISAALSNLSDGAAIQSLALTLASTKILIQTIATTATPVNAAKAGSLAAIENALNALQRGNDPTLTGTSAAGAATELNALAMLLANAGDNIALETLKAASSALNAARTALPTTVTGGKALRVPVKTVLYWSNLAISQAADLARLARKGIINGEPAKDDSDNSAYTAARKLLASLDGQNGSIALFEKSAKTLPGQPSTEANEALANTSDLLQKLLAAADNLDSLLESSMAKAGTPTVWYTAACTFLQPATGSKTWWTAHAWNTLFFYQLSDQIRPEIGKLQVNGTSKLRAVVLAAGRAINGQDRSIRQSGSFLEGKNQDTSRNGDAKSPVTQFSSETVSTNFNDRLAY